MACKTGKIVRRGPTTWLVRIYVGRDSETRRRRYVGKFIHGGLRSAQAHLNRMLAGRDLGRNIRSSRQTLSMYLDHWLNICARPRLRVKSFRDYSTLLARYVRPRLGSILLGELSSGEIQALYGELLKRKLSGRTICYTHSVLFSALRQAVRWKLLLENPAQDVHLPRQARRRLIVLDVEQSKQFIAAISGHEYEALFALAITTGMRPSEYLALTWSDFDLEHGAVSISKTLEWPGREWLFEDTKRERSRRVVKLQNWVTALLGRLKEKARLADVRSGDLVFKSPNGGPIREPKLKAPFQAFARACRPPKYPSLRSAAYSCYARSGGRGLAEGRERTTWARLGSVHA